MLAASNTRTATPQKKRGRRMWGQLPYSRAESLANIMLRAIRRDLGHAIFFTREDVSQLKIFGHVSTSTRYQTVCLLVKFLVSGGLLIEKNRTNLCLPDHQLLYSEQPLRLQYADTIEHLVTALPPAERKNFTVMDIVGAWRVDPQLTTDNKRTAVRGAMPGLIKKGVITRHNELFYSVEKQLVRH